jgi:hypothetical protein
MKKSIYLLTTCLFFSPALHAGKYFDSYIDENGHQAIYIKKSGHRFPAALNSVRNHLKFHSIQQVYFHDNLSEQQRREVIRMLEKEKNGVEHGNSFLEDTPAHQATAESLNVQVMEGPVFQKDMGLNLRDIDKGILKQSLPFLHQMVEGMDKVETLHVHQSGFIDPDMLPALQKALALPNIQRVYFHGESDLSERITPAVTQQIHNFMRELLLMGKAIIFHFPLYVLKTLSPDVLDEMCSDSPIRELQAQYPKVIMPHSCPGSLYGGLAMKDYKKLCESQYSPFFKATFSAFQNERIQSMSLGKILTENVLEAQLEHIDDVLSKETQSHKSLRIYKNALDEIKDNINKQIMISKKDNQEYLTLENKKRELVQFVLHRMGPGVVRQ